jgi:hypothetical protein
LVGDVLELHTLSTLFDRVRFHVFDDGDLARYVASLRAAVP